LGKGHRVRVMTRHPDSPAARELAQLGAQVVAGDLDDAASMEPAVKGKTAAVGRHRSGPLDAAIAFSRWRLAMRFMILLVSLILAFLTASPALAEGPPGNLQRLQPNRLIRVET
jgi:hypothetical protein